MQKELETAIELLVEEGHRPASPAAWQALLAREFPELEGSFLTWRASVLQVRRPNQGDMAAHSRPSR
jgi:hypothetical protein